MKILYWKKTNAQIFHASTRATLEGFITFTVLQGKIKEIGTKSFFAKLKLEMSDLMRNQNRIAELVSK